MGQKDIDGIFPGWTGHLQNYAGAITPASELTFTPALRGIRASGAGNVVVTLNGDSLTDAAKKVTIALSANTLVTDYAIAKVWNSGTTATGIEGFQ